MKKTLFYVMLLSILLVGCGGYNVFKDLGVNSKDIPSYEVGGEITNTQKFQDKEIDQKFVNIDAEGKSEEEVKKIAGDYIQKNMDKNEMIVMSISTERKKSYTIEYYANKEASELMGVKQKIKKYPVTIFREND